MAFIRTRDAFENLRQYGFRDPEGHSLTMCEDFIEAQSRHAAMLSACEKAAAELEEDAKYDVRFAVIADMLRDAATNATAK